MKSRRVDWSCAQSLVFCFQYQHRQTQEHNSPMTAEPATDPSVRKQEIRERAHANRNAQENKDELSRQIVARCMQLPEYQQAKTVLFYIDVRSEVRTRNDLANALTGGKKIVVPYCVDGELELFHLEHNDELAIGM